MNDRTITIVTVDRHIEDSKIIKDMIEIRSSFRLVAQFHNGEDTLRDYSDLKPDVIIITRYLDDMTDIDLMTKIKDIHPACIFVNVSVADEMEWTQQTMSVGSRFYLSKPIIAAQFSKTIERAYDVFTRHRNELENG